MLRYALYDKFSNTNYFVWIFLPVFVPKNGISRFIVNSLKSLQSVLAIIVQRNNDISNGGSILFENDNKILIFDKENLIPFKGTDSIQLYQTIDIVREALDKYQVGYSIELWESTSETVPNPWKVIVIEGVLSLFFAKNNKLFKIVAWDNYKGTLPNGIAVGMNISDAQKLDSTLIYNEWNEDYESDNGYWVEDDVESNTIMSISIFIKEVLEEDTFDYCKW